MTQGDRSTRFLSIDDDYHIYDKYGQKALDDLINICLGIDQSCIPFHRSNDTSITLGELRISLASVGVVNSDFSEVKLQNRTPAKFLNRILGMQLTMQNKVLCFLKRLVQFHVQKDQTQKIYDSGIQGKTLKYSTRVSILSYV